MSDMQDRVRLDKWLWAARFYKTRGLAQDAIEAGHVSLNGERAKPSRLVKAGDRIELRLNQLEYMLNVLLPLDRRGSATIARTMYQETAESQQRREARQLQLAAERASEPERAAIRAVISNRADAYGLVRAQNAGIPTRVLDHKQFDGREAFDAALIEAIDGFDPQLVVLAGFMRILTGDFVRHYEGRLLNIHPSLLPKYKGLNTHQRALEAGDREHGCSVHFVTEELDGGPLVVQAVVPVESDDTPESLAQRVHRQEHHIYPLAMRWFAEGRLKLGKTGAQLDGKDLPATGHLIRP